jgi:hypothetical protein
VSEIDDFPEGDKDLQRVQDLYFLKLVFKYHHSIKITVIYLTVQEFYTVAI